MPSGAEQAAAAARAAKKNRPPEKSSIIGGVFSAVFSKESGMARYSKLIASIFGSILGVVVSVVFGFVISKGFGSCTVEAAVEVCRVAGYTQGEVTAWIMGLLMTYLGAQAVYSFPPNTKVVSTAAKPASGKK